MCGSHYTFFGYHWFRPSSSTLSRKILYLWVWSTLVKVSALSPQTFLFILPTGRNLLWGPASAPMSLAPSSTRTSSLSLAKILQTLAASLFSSSVPENPHPGSTVLHFLSGHTWGLSSQHGGTKSTADSLQSNGAQCTLEMVLQTALLYFPCKFTPPFSMIIMSSFPQSLQTSKFLLIPADNLVHLEHCRSPFPAWNALWLLGHCIHLGLFSVPSLDCRVEMPPFSPDAQKAHLPVGAEGGRGVQDAGWGSPRIWRPQSCFGCTMPYLGDCANPLPLWVILSSFLTKDHHGWLQCFSLLKSPHTREWEHLSTRNNPKGAEELPFVIFHPDLIQSPLIQQTFGKEVKGSKADGAPTQSHTCHMQVHHSLLG